MHKFSQCPNPHCPNPDPYRRVPRGARFCPHCGTEMPRWPRLVMLLTTLIISGLLGAWGGLTGWTGPTDLLPLIFMGLVLPAFSIAEGIRVRRPLRCAIEAGGVGFLFVAASFFPFYRSPETWSGEGFLLGALIFSGEGFLLGGASAAIARYVLNDITRRKWWVAGLLSIVVPGLGQVYNGQAKRGLFLYGLLWVVGLASLGIMLVLPLAPFNIVVPFVILLSAYIYIFIDAMIIARKQGNSYQPRAYNKWYIYLMAMFVAVVVVLPVLSYTMRSVLVFPFKIHGRVEDAVLPGERILANMFVYGPRLPFTKIRLPGLREPEPGDIILFKDPHTPSRIRISRCVAVAGQTVQTRNKDVPVIPKQNVVGKAIRVCWSWDSTADRVRWERIGQTIR